MPIITGMACPDIRRSAAGRRPVRCRGLWPGGGSPIRIWSSVSPARRHSTNPTCRPSPGAARRAISTIRRSRCMRPLLALLTLAVVALPTLADWPAAAGAGGAWRRGHLRRCPVSQPGMTEALPQFWPLPAVGQARRSAPKYARRLKPAAERYPKVIWSPHRDLQAG